MCQPSGSLCRSATSKTCGSNLDLVKISESRAAPIARRREGEGRGLPGRADTAWNELRVDVWRRLMKLSCSKVFWSRGSSHRVFLENQSWEFSVFSASSVFFTSLILQIICALFFF